MNLQAPIAGPSRPRPAPSFDRYSSRSDPPSSSSRSSTPSLHRKSSSIFGDGFSTPTPSSHIRYSTPSLNGGSSTPVFYPNGARFRSQSVLSTSQREDELINKKRLDSFQKLKSSWDLLKEKYGSISLEDDDEIDLRTGKVVKDRGRLRDYVGREFGEIPISDHETQTDGDGESKGEGGYEIDSDEDEIGLWDERSGLDPQVTEPPLLWEMENKLRRTKSWVSEEDQDDLKEFLSLEAQRNRLLGHDDSIREDEGSPEPDHSNMDSAETWKQSRFRGTRILPVSATLDDLFNSDQEKVTSEDELQLIDDEVESDEDVRVHSIVAPYDDPVVDTHPQSPSPPPPRRRGKTLQVEVVIPIRSRRKSLPAPAFTKPPIFESPTFEGPPKSQTMNASFSAPSLTDLFNDPPPEDDLCSRSPSWSPLRSPSPEDPSPSPTQDGHDCQTAIVLSLSPSPRESAHLPSRSLATTAPRVDGLSKSAKGKERMAGERPNESLPTTPISFDSPYYTRLWKTPSGAVKSCKRCRKVGGERADKAPLCKGRVDLAKCTFERHTINLGETSRPKGHDEPAQQRALLSDKGRPTHNAEDGSESILSEHDITINTLKQRSSGEKQRRSHKRCMACKEAGGERAQNAQTCPGGFKRRWCQWYEEESIEVTDELPTADPQSNARVRSGASILPDVTPHTTDASDTDDAPLKLRKSGSRRKSIVLTSDSEAETIQQRPIPRMSSTPFRTPNRASSEFIGTPSERPTDLNQSLYASALIYRSNGRARYCGACYEAGGSRAERAWWCKGRAWGKFCHFLKDNVESDYESPTESPIKKSSRGVNSGRRTPEVLVRSCSVTRTKRKRVVSTGTSQLPPTPSPALGQIVTNTSYMPSPPPTSSVEPCSPNANTSVTTVRPVIERASSSFSMPPSSPPIFDGRPVHPTPSPSLSAAPVGESPIVQRISKPFMSSPTQITGFGPTPPPSIDGARSSSMLSDDIPLTLPRKSILRKPSESPYSTSSASGSGSVKRARFSLKPRSPVREESSDPLHQGRTSEDELSIHNNTFEYSSSPSSPATCFSRYSIPSSSPLRNEWSVRAADIGMKLGPEHTGSLPEGMIKALAPSMARSSPSTFTLGSSVLVNETFSLPTPPTSSSSTSTISMTNGASTSSPALSGGRRRTPTSNGVAETGLMLPPPVPLKRSTPAPTSNSSDSSSTPSTSTGTLPIPSQPIDQPTRCTPLPRSSLSSRSRSRSMSDQPSSFSRLSTPSHKAPSREVSSTSRKKSRVEMELARKALELGDDAGLEWGLDEDTEDGGRMWREGSVALLRSEL